MEQINTIGLSDPDLFPSEEVLAKVLGDGYSLYRELVATLESRGMSHEWRYYRDGKAWLCKAQKGKKTIMWMSAWKGYLKATVYIPEKSLEGVWLLGLRDSTKAFIRDSRNVGKSKPCMFDLADAEALRELGEVMDYKAALR